jgi:hypothetical protein
MIEDMSMTFSKTISTGALSIEVALIFLSGLASAQTPGQKDLIVAVASALPDPQAGAIIMRYAEPSKRDIIVMKPEAANAATLALTLRRLERLRALGRPSHDLEILTITTIKPQRDWQRGIDPRFQQVLTQLFSRPVAQVGNLGAGHWIILPAIR